MPTFNAIGHLFEDYTPSIILAVFLVCWQRFSVKLDPSEPPLLKPLIPYIGHIIGILKDSSSYFDKLYAKHPVPIATLPMVNGKMYMINSPALVQSAYRAKNLSFDPFMIEFAQATLGVSDEAMKPVKRPEFIPAFVKGIHEAMAGEYLHKMNADALNNLSVTFNEMGKSFECESLYLWLRDIMTMATCNALLGSHNPMKNNPHLLDALWDFEGGTVNFLLHIPAFLAPKAYKGRADLQAALINYYTAKHDQEPDVSQMAKSRANLYRKYSIPAEDIGRFELALLQVSTANAIPTLFWNLVFIESDPAIISATREELIGMIKSSPSSNNNGRREISIDITKFEFHAPLLVSSYRETIRLANSQVGTRRVMSDTIISDGKKEYLLRAGADLQMPAGVAQTSPTIWGPNAAFFNARRFLKPEEKGLLSEKAKEEDKEQKKAYFPFGGGKHLCPGRNFAFAEILGALAVLLLGFEVKGTDGGLIGVPELGRAKLGEGVAKPRGKGLEMGAKITRREGWEDVVYKFTVS